MTTTTTEIAKESCEDRAIIQRKRKEKSAQSNAGSSRIFTIAITQGKKKENVVVIVDKKCYMHHCRRFRLRASSGSSSSSRSAVSAGLSSECTLDAILDRLVGGPGVSMPLKGYRAPGSVHPLSALRVDGTGSFDPGGVPCLDGTCRGPRGSW